MVNILMVNHKVTTHETEHKARQSPSGQTKSDLLNEQNKYKLVLYTLVSQNYIDAKENMDDIVNDYNKLNENENDRQLIRMEHFNEIVNYLKTKIRDINEQLLYLTEDKWDTENDILKLYQQHKQMKAKQKLETLDKNVARNLKGLIERKRPREFRYKRSPLERKPLKFHDLVFNFDRNKSVEMDDIERKFATGNFKEQLEKWQKEQEERDRLKAAANETTSGNGTTYLRLRRDATHPRVETTPPIGESSANHRETMSSETTPTSEPTRATLPDFVDNFGGGTEDKYDQFVNVRHMPDGRDPAKFTVRKRKFNPHPSAEYFVDKVDNWVSWAKQEATRLANTPTTSPLSTLDYYYSKASISRFFSLNPRYLQSTDEDGLNKWGGRQILPRSQEDFTFDIRSWPPALNTEASEEIRSFQTWRDAVDWTRVPSNRPSTHPYVSVEIEQCLNKIFKCVSCKKYETKDLTRYVDHLYEHYQRNSLMIPDSPLTPDNTYETKDLTRYVDHLYEHFLRNSLMIPSFEEILTELRRRETVTGSETWRREF
ncbi:hypothetical protein M8J76_003045 [Diaphorina citri]|nr:hypothetical protein M8J76_003045 [Diaphorina citri]